MRAKPPAISPFKSGKRKEEADSGGLGREGAAATGGRSKRADFFWPQGRLEMIHRCGFVYLEMRGEFL